MIKEKIRAEKTDTFYIGFRRMPSASIEYTVIFNKEYPNNKWTFDILENKCTISTLKIETGTIRE